MMNPDFKELLFVLNAEKVQYMVVGGWAVSLHAQPRSTKDIDILVRPKKNNAVALFRALAKFGTPLDNLKPDDFCEKDSFFRMGTPPLMVDILTSISGVDFDKAYKRRTMVDIDEQPVSFISAEDLLEAKKASGHPQDLADVKAILKAQKETAEGQPKAPVKRTRKPKKKPDTESQPKWAKLALRHKITPSDA